MIFNSVILSAAKDLAIDGRKNAVTSEALRFAQSDNVTGEKL